MADPAILVENLGKKYSISHQVQRERYSALRDVLSGAARGFGRSLVDRMTGVRRTIDREEFWALRGVTFKLAQGDIVGIVGRNGAGKSTLLRVLSRITDPSEGRVTIRGRVASLLEVGTGFHPELTGRENIYLNGAILGMTRAEVRRKFDEIVAFADVERFLDTPVKRYSSGMYMRLAFSVAAFLESDILVVDEVLAVGDAAFQKKCLGRMGDVSASGRTVLFVSHNIGSLLSICRSGILLSAGRLMASGDMQSVAQAYQRMGQDAASGLSRAAFHGPLADLEFKSIELNGALIGTQSMVRPMDCLTFRIRGASVKPLPNFRFSFGLFRDGVRLFTVHDGPENLPGGAFEFLVTLPSRLLRPGDYQISLGGRRVDGNEWCWGVDLATVTVMDEWDDHYDRDNLGMINISNAITRHTPGRTQFDAVQGSPA